MILREGFSTYSLHSFLFSNPSHKKIEQLSFYIESKLIERQVEDLKMRAAETERDDLQVSYTDM